MSAVRHGSAIPQHARPLRKTPRHTADACRDRSNTPHLALPRRRSFHPLTYGERVCPSQLPLGRCQCGISYKLLSEGHGRLSRVEAELLGHPPREWDIQVVDDRHNVIRDTDRLIWHVRIVRIDYQQCNHPNVAGCHSLQTTSPAHSVGQSSVSRAANRSKYSQQIDQT